MERKYCNNCFGDWHARSRSEYSSSLLRVHIVCYSLYIFQMHCYIIDHLVYILRKITVTIIGVPNIYNFYGYVLYCYEVSNNVQLITNKLLVKLCAQRQLTWILLWLDPDLSIMSRTMRKPVFVICKQQRRRSACTSAQSDQHLCCSLPG